MHPLHSIRFRSQRLWRRHGWRVTHGLLAVRSRIQREARVAGVRVPIDPGLPDAALRALYDGTYERPEIRALQSVLTPDDRVLELGAGLGVVSTLAAQLVGSERVLTLEPNASTAVRARRTHRANGVHPELREVAAGASDGTVTLRVGTDFRTSSTRRPADDPEPSAFVPTLIDQVQVPRVAVESVLAEVAATVVVMDIEGVEVEVLPALRLDAHPEVRAVVAEIHTRLIGRDRHEVLHQELEGAGFTVTVVHEVPERAVWLARRGSP